MKIFKTLRIVRSAGGEEKQKQIEIYCITNPRFLQEIRFYALTILLSSSHYVHADERTFVWPGLGSELGQLQSQHQHLRTDNKSFTYCAVFGCTAVLCSHITSYVHICWNWRKMNKKKAQKKTQKPFYLFNLVFVLLKICFFLISSSSSYFSFLSNILIPLTSHT